MIREKERMAINILRLSLIHLNDWEINSTSDIEHHLSTVRYYNYFPVPH